MESTVNEYGIGNCATLYLYGSSFDFDDAQCDYPLPFLCEFELYSEHTITPATQTGEFNIPEI